MKLYKYRNFSNPDCETYKRLSQILRQHTFWCAHPSSLNDPDEFVWSCDYAPTDATISLLAQILVKFRNRTLAEATRVAAASILAGRLETLTTPIVQMIIDQCRGEFGIACFGTSGQNPVCWERYGGAGAGVCIEIEVPSALVGKQLFPVQYPEKKSLHIDQLLRSALGPLNRKQVYEVCLLSKPPCWSTEAEIRFVSKQQNVSVLLDGSRISSVTLGPNLTAEALHTINRIIESLPYRLPLVMHEARPLNRADRLEHTLTIKD